MFLTIYIFIISQSTLFIQIFLSFYIHSFLPVEDCSSGSRKLVVLSILARDRF